MSSVTEIPFIFFPLVKERECMQLNISHKVKSHFTLYKWLHHPLSIMIIRHSLVFPCSLTDCFRNHSMSPPLSICRGQLQRHELHSENHTDRFLHLREKKTEQQNLYRTTVYLVTWMLQYDSTVDLVDLVEWNTAQKNLQIWSCQ